MEITVSKENGRVPVTVMHLDGNLDGSSYEAFEAQAEALVADGTRRLLVDLSHAPFVSSAGLRALHTVFLLLRKHSPDVSDDEMHRQINAGTYKSPQLKLLNPSEGATKTLRTTGLDMYLEIHRDLQQAIQSF